MQRESFDSATQTSGGPYAPTSDEGRSIPISSDQGSHVGGINEEAANRDNTGPRTEYRSGNDMFNAVRTVLDRRFHWMVVDDVIAVVRGYAGNGLRDSAGEFRPHVLTAVRAVAGRRCDAAMAVTVLTAIEEVWDSKAVPGRGRLA